MIGSDPVSNLVGVVIEVGFVASAPALFVPRASDDWNKGLEARFS